MEVKELRLPVSLIPDQVSCLLLPFPAIRTTGADPGISGPAGGEPHFSV
jgi:hypothetical protein